MCDYIANISTIATHFFILSVSLAIANTLCICDQLQILENQPICHAWYNKKFSVCGIVIGIEHGHIAIQDIFDVSIAS